VLFKIINPQKNGHDVHPKPPRNPSLVLDDIAHLNVPSNDNNEKICGIGKNEMKKKKGHF
jgi:hypothetical protein